MKEYMRNEYYRREYQLLASEARPARTDIISNDDILNLRIALELSGDVREFLEDHHIFMK